MPPTREVSRNRSRVPHRMSVECPQRPSIGRVPDRGRCHRHVHGVGGRVRGSALPPRVAHGGAIPTAGPASPHGACDGVTAVSIIYSRWGQRSGAHMNPAVTLTFFRLGKVAPPDLAGYVAAQFTGSVLGMAVAAALLGPLSNNSVHYVATVLVPGDGGVPRRGPDFVRADADGVVRLQSSSLGAFHRRVRRPARVDVYHGRSAFVGDEHEPGADVGSALLAHDFPGLWIYFTAPPLGC